MPQVLIQVILLFNLDTVHFEDYKRKNNLPL